MDYKESWQPRVENGCLFIDDTDLGGAMLQHHARPGIGSYIHPVRVGARHLCLTADSPWHHPHQHGIQTRFVGINGSDFWHFPGQRPGQTLGRINPALPRITGTKPPRWVIEALWQHADGGHVLADRQDWQLGRAGDVLVLDLDWTLRAIPDARIEPYLYGGLYVRMPYHRHLGATVVTSAGNRDLAAEQDTDWSFRSPGRKQILVETATWYGIPHSVTTTSWVDGGALYVPCNTCATKRWPKNVARNPDVRLKIDGEVYERRAVRITDDEERQRLLRVLGATETPPHRWVFRMDPRATMM